MRTLLVSTNRFRNPAPVMPLGACLVAEAAERAGHAVEFLDLMPERAPLRALAERLDRVRPELVGLSVRNIDNGDMAGPIGFHHELPPLMDVIRRGTRAPVVLGGSAVGIMPEALLRLTGADWAAMGDGEVAFPNQLDALVAGRPTREVPGTAWLQAGRLMCNDGPVRCPLDVCRAPDFARRLDLRFYRSRLSPVPLQTKRGCPFGCIYCTYPMIEGRAYRLGSPESVAAAVRELAAIGLRDIEFVDNVFNAPYEHAMAICDTLARGSCRARLQTLDVNPRFLDDALLAAMTRAGFVGIGISAESASDAVLRRLQKGFSSADLHRAAAAVRRGRLPCMWIFLFGAPGETRETVQETLRFIETEIRPTDVAFINAGLRIYPGTELERMAAAEGVLEGRGEALLEPAFYLSPALEAEWLKKTIFNEFAARRLNCVGLSAVSRPWMDKLLRLGAGLGLRAPLWRHTRLLRRTMRLFGAEA